MLFNKFKNDYLICVGAQKAGTTLLYELLKDHTQLNIGKTKELHYFNKAKNQSIKDYNQLFIKSTGVKFDVTPCYLFYKNALENIASVLKKKEKKILIILRNPLKRAQSHYFMSIK